MKIIRTEYLVCAGDFPKSTEWESLHCDIDCGVKAVSWEGLAGHHDEAVITAWRRSFVGQLASLGWETDLHLDNTRLKTCTPFDAGCVVESKFVVAEFAVSNLQCANTALCKMALGLIRGVLAAGVLVVAHDPRRQRPRVHTLAFAELTNYFDLWKALNVEDGLLVLISVE